MSSAFEKNKQVQLNVEFVGLFLNLKRRGCYEINFKPAEGERKRLKA